MKAGIRLALWIVLMSGAGLLAMAQQTPPPANSDSAAPTQSTDAGKAKQALTSFFNMRFEEPEL